MLKIFNTLTRRKDEFVPLDQSAVTFYHCGPTVYWTQHIGNMRAMVLADLIRRTLEYLGWPVKMVRNYTDVGHLTSDEDQGEDKMEAGARREGRSPQEIAQKYIDIFESDLRDLNVLEPAVKPRATEHIPEMIAAVQVLLDKGCAYSTDLAVYFDVSKAVNYNQLSRQVMDRNIADAGKGEVSDPSKRNPADFALWFFKAGSHKNAIQTWPSPFSSPLVRDGQGFPGWHIECSAMSRKYLGDTLDLHMGGIEHIPVHHTNEIAQSEAITGRKYVNYWIHNEHLTVNGGKMSKSEGTAYSVAELKEKGYDPLALRYFFLQAQCRARQNFTWDALDAARIALNGLRSQVAALKAQQPGTISADSKAKFTAALEDNFNSPQALAIVWNLLKSDVGPADKLATLLDFNRVLGLDLASVEAAEIPPQVREFAEERLQARRAKQWAESDRLRDEIRSLGFEIEDQKEGYLIRARD